MTFNTIAVQVFASLRKLLSEASTVYITVNIAFHSTNGCHNKLYIQHSTSFLLKGIWIEKNGQTIHWRYLFRHYLIFHCYDNIPYLVCGVCVTRSTKVELYYLIFYDMSFFAISYFIRLSIALLMNFSDYRNRPMFNRYNLKLIYLKWEKFKLFNSKITSKVIMQNVTIINQF